MRKLFLIAIFLPLWANLNAQEPGDVYYYQFDNTKRDIVTLFQGSCQTTTADIGRKAEIKIIQALAGDKFEIGIVWNMANDEAGENFALTANNYCISKKDLSTYFRSTKIRSDFGVLAVPFKLRFDPVQITAGGELGGYWGPYISRNTALIFHAGLTFISLNDVNSDTPETKLGVTGGLGFVKKVTNEFQIGVVSGIDVFEGVEDWPYKFQPWLSLQVGWQFTKTRIVPDGN